MNIIEKMKQIREEKNMSYAELASILDIQEQILVMLELGEIVPNGELEEKIEEFILDSI